LVISLESLGFIFFKKTVIMAKGITHNKTPCFFEAIVSISLIKLSDLDDFNSKIKGINTTDKINKFSINHK